MPSEIDTKERRTRSSIPTTTRSRRCTSIWSSTRSRRSRTTRGCACRKSIRSFATRARPRWRGRQPRCGGPASRPVSRSRFSVFAEAVLHKYLPEAGWRPLLTGFGYTVRFSAGRTRAPAIVHRKHDYRGPAGRRQSHREEFSIDWLRLWAIVSAANLTGTLIAALFSTFAPAPIPGIPRNDHRDQPPCPSAHGFFEAIFLAIPAGFLIAAMVWLMPSAETARFHVVTLVTYIIAIGGFSHIVVGGFEAFMLLRERRDRARYDAGAFSRSRS